MLTCFNSIKVRLNQDALSKSPPCLSSFNSIKVRLNQIPPKVQSIPNRFQFHKGTIKPLLTLLSISIETCFNSIKVRLNQHNLSCLPFLRLFQFHKGTIKPLCIGQHKQQIHMFQFHKGTIKPCKVCNYGCSRCSVSIP